ncbi:MAG: dipicolinate synthase subunit B [Ruminococcaceae bacterium]|nr:dipicolinate synthase subunit B [Oscillospiraceae bacterium]
MLNIGFAMCGSFCTFKKATDLLDRLKEKYSIVPVMSEAAYGTDTRFGKAEEHISRIEEITGKSIIHTITDAEPIGPKKLLDALIICPCTGNTLGKLANGITDTPVTLAAKAHLRNGRPLLISVSTNDALAASAKNIGALMNYRNIFFVPMRQDDFINKPNSIVADFDMTEAALEAALDGRQLQPVLIK